MSPSLPPRGLALVLRYGLFALIAVIANLAAQRLVLMFGESSLHFALAVFCGTGAGLVVKYLLDRRWIFYAAPASGAAQGKEFGLYTVMGLVTTAIFWGFETAFWLGFGTHLAREIGAVIGLGIGYVVKYWLDARFVFTARQAA